eukprot:TRINITY_DN58659_c0_g1_i2.p1 TRINITY_DN58659_c0_g1~~TRINITY_DN58659_c0_g1_i2.p1  ORF type:complete len:220 (-),score=22.96 TRINITY_DN58659_c0_g1_i2:58-717(-)
MLRLRQLWANYLRALEETPVRANVLTAGTLGFTGDVICQIGVEGHDRMDWRRCFAMTSFGAGYMGVIAYRIYSAYRLILPANVLKVPLYEGLVCSAIDNFVHCPCLYLPVFYAWTEMVQGRTATEAYETFRTAGLTSMFACWSIWIPFQILNFGFVPPANRTASVNVMCLLWNVILDHIASNPAEETRSQGAHCSTPDQAQAALHTSCSAHESNGPAKS